MGDVALVLPVVRSMVQAYPHAEVTVVTRPRLAPFFQDIERVQVFPADVAHTYKGLVGLYRLYRTLTRTSAYDAIIDLHDHIRTMILRTFFRLHRGNVTVFDKGRSEKRAFARKSDKVTTPLPHTVRRYQDAFAKAGYPFDLLPGPHFALNDDVNARVEAWLLQRGLRKSGAWIGIAPFALHKTKIWPLENYAIVIEKVLQHTQAKFHLFGGGPQEIAFFQGLVRRFPDHCVLAAGELNLREEIALMKHMDLMLCVDSSNMHMAALNGVRVLSIWGGTHPDVGFAPFATDAEIVQITRDELPCRPCSVYGRETCYVGGFPCLTRITPDLIADRILNTVREQTTRRE